MKLLKSNLLNNPSSLEFYVAQSGRWNNLLGDKFCGRIRPKKHRKTRAKSTPRITAVEKHNFTASISCSTNELQLQLSTKVRAPILSPIFLLKSLLKSNIKLVKKSLLYAVTITPRISFGKEIQSAFIKSFKNSILIGEQVNKFHFHGIIKSRLAEDKIRKKLKTIFAECLIHIQKYRNSGWVDYIFKSFDEKTILITNIPSLGLLETKTNEARIEEDMVGVEEATGFILSNTAGAKPLPEPTIEVGSKEFRNNLYKEIMNGDFRKVEKEVRERGVKVGKKDCHGSSSR